MTSQRSEAGRQPAGRRSGGRRPDSSRGAGRGGAALAVAAYAVLLLFGAGQGLLGVFFYGVGPSPLMAICFATAIFMTCAWGSVGMRSALGGLAPAVGWFAVTFLLASGTSGGSVLVTATTAGEVFLFGGALGAAAGLVAGFARWSGSRGRP